MPDGEDDVSVVSAAAACSPAAVPVSPVASESDKGRGRAGAGRVGEASFEGVADPSGVVADGEPELLPPRPRPPRRRRRAPLGALGAGSPSAIPPDPPPDVSVVAGLPGLVGASLFAGASRFAGASAFGGVAGLGNGAPRLNAAMRSSTSGSVGAFGPATSVS
jgi:hypothetical protein